MKIAGQTLEYLYIIHYVQQHGKQVILWDTRNRFSGAWLW